MVYSILLHVTNSESIFVNLQISVIIVLKLTFLSTGKLSSKLVKITFDVDIDIYAL